MCSYFLLFLYALLVFEFHIQPTFAKIGGIKCREKEKQALLMFKRSLQNNSMLSTWRDHQYEDCCNWKGVQCNNQTGHVTLLHLQGTMEHYLIGAINDSLTELQHLTYLDVSFNDFSESHIPIFICSLRSLEYLNLSKATFGGTIPHQLGMLPYLRYLDLKGNQLDGVIPYQLGTLSHLQYIDLSDNELNGTIPYQLGMLHHLQYLDLSWNQLVKAIPYQLGTLSHLQYLDLSGNELNETIPCQFGLLPYLQHLDLSLNQLGGEVPYQLGNLSQLMFLDVSDNFLKGEIPFHFGNLFALKFLSLSYNDGLKICEENHNDTIEWLSNLSSLTDLHLSGLFNLNHCNHWIQLVGMLPSLRNLDIRSSSLSDTNLLFPSHSHLNFSSSLSIIDISYNMFTSSKIFKWLFNSTSNLHELHLSNNFLKGFIQDDFDNMGSLKYLDLSNNNLEGEIPKFIQNCTSNLRELDLSHNFLKGFIPDDVSSNLLVLDLSHNFLKGFIQDDFNNMSSLKYLDLSNNNLEGEIPKFIRKCTSNLRVLYLSHNFLKGFIPNDFTSNLHVLDLSNNFLKGFIQDDFDNMSSLKYLELSNNNLEGDIPKFIRNCTSNLRGLYLSGNFLKSLNIDDFDNMSSLEVLDLSKNSLEGEIPMAIGNICTLQSLIISYNHLNTGLSSLIHNSSGCFGRALRLLDLSENQLHGEIPKNIGSLTLLNSLYLYRNSLKGIITEVHFTNLSKLETLDLSYNSLVLNFSDHWIPTFQLRWLYVASCKLGPSFPKWLQKHIYLSSLDISDAKINDFVPEWFWEKSQNLSFLNMSYNNLGGIIPNIPLTLNYFPEYILTSNQFEGSLPPFMLRASVLRLSKNKFSDLNLFSCDKETPEDIFLGILDVSSNQLAGKMPNCWNHLKALVFLDLSNNKLSGEIPTSLGALVNLEALVLRNNSLARELPSSLMNCTKLLMLDVGQNKLSGPIPSWIGKSQQPLAILSVRLNSISGSLPSSLCYLRHIQVLDLSVNSLSGGIPRCLKNLTSMAQQIINSSDYIDAHYFSTNYSGYHEFDFQLFMMWKGAESEFKNPELLLKSIDLSSNHLSGEIPIEIGDLLGLVSLNLSRNNLSGQVTPKIGNLKSLEFLDLSRNNLFGKIPSSLTQIDRLTKLDVSNNHLCGRIPIGTQLQSFDASNYEGNLCLCGKPLNNECPKEKMPTTIVEDKNEKSAFKEAFYMSMGLGFPIGFWGFLLPILLKQSWRHAYLRFLNDFIDSIFVMVAVNMHSRLQLPA